VLGHIKQLRKLLPENIDLIGIGGIACGGDMAEYLAVGATCVQVTTAYAGARDHGIFADILSEYANYH
jgi:dihydroorotate dehydrogenase (fumarate)